MSSPQKDVKWEPREQGGRPPLLRRGHEPDSPDDLNESWTPNSTTTARRCSAARKGARSGPESKASTILSDLNVHLEDMIASGDMVGVRGTMPAR